MRIFWSLCKQHLRNNRLTTAIWLVIVAMMAYFVASVAESVVSGNNLEQILDSLGGLKNLFGNTDAYRYPADIYIHGKWLAFMPLLMGIFGVLSALGILAREIDRRTADFVLTLPVPRATVLMSRFTALAINIGLLYLGSFVMLWVGLRQAHVPGAFGGYALYSVGQYGLTILFSALTLLVSLCLDDYTVTNRYGLIGVVGFYALYLILNGVGTPSLAALTFYGLVNAEQVVGRGHFPWLAVLVGGLLTFPVPPGQRRTDGREADTGVN